MSDLDYETLFNDIMVQTRDKRKTLKEVLDRVFEDDSGRTAEVLADMMRVNEKAQAIESSRPGFMNLMTAMRSVRSVREELLEKVDNLMDEIRRFLALKEELANAHLERLTTLFREELGNPQFRFHFHLLDDQELHHLSEVRSNARKETGQSSETPALPPREPESHPSRENREPARETHPSRENREPAREPVRESYREQEPPPRAAAPPAPAAEPEPEWSSSTPAADENSWSANEEKQPSWLSQSAHESNPPTIRGPAPDAHYAHEEPQAAAAPHAEPEPEPESEEAQGGSPYEVDVDVLRILSEETFRPPKR